MSKLETFYLNVKYGIKNLIKWCPIIWRDRDWDHSYLFAILEYKLKNMSELHEKYGNTANSQEKAETLRELSELAKKIKEEDYLDEAIGDKRHLIDKLELKIENNRLISTGLTKEESDELLEVSMKEYQLLKKDVDKLFDTMKRDVTSWWD